MELFWKRGENALDYIQYWIPGNRRKNATERPLEAHIFPIYEMLLKDLPSALDGIFICSDLQGHVREKNDYRLLGEWLPEYLALFLAEHFPMLKSEYIGVALCGDLFAMTHRRGGAGDVRPVWKAFNQRFRWVTGVAGNHDLFGEEEDFAHFRNSEGIHFLEKDCIELDGLSIAGLSGIISSKDKPFRLYEEDYLEALGALLRHQPDLLLLHESPATAGFQGNEAIQACLEQAAATTVFCGHNHWPQVEATSSNGTRVFNLDARALFLHRGD